MAQLFKRNKGLRQKFGFSTPPARPRSEGQHHGPGHLSDFEGYFDKVRRWAQEELNVKIPLPNGTEFGT